MIERDGRLRSWWGWGWEEEAYADTQVKELGKGISQYFGVDEFDIVEAPGVDRLELRSPRIEPPGSLASICSTDPYDRASHAYGQSFRDVIRSLHGDVTEPPDLVVFPETEAEVVDLLDWSASSGAAVVPYGGGSSVVGGVEAGGPWFESFSAVVTIDLTRMARVLEVDKVSRCALIQAGALGPVIESQLRPMGLTLRHFPQSFEFSSLGGWIATRSGGHFATNYTHIDDLTESVRMVTPKGIWETRRLPASGAGPSPDRMVLGSEGTLGIVTQAWMRLQDRPIYRARASVMFSSYENAVEAVRAISQAALFPTNCRLLDPGEAARSAGVTDGSALLVLAFESADHPVDAWINRAVELVRDHGGSIPNGVRSSAEGAAGKWRDSFIKAPYLRDAMLRLGCVADTFETAITWDRFEEFHQGITTAVNKALTEVCGAGTLSCRFTHVYPDGPAPYYTWFGVSKHGSQLAHWHEIKAAASEAILAGGGTITHHHAVGRDHREWYDRERPAPFAAAFTAAKRELDPGGILNPGVLVDPGGSRP